jgi:hypothetical protein
MAAPAPSISHGALEEQIGGLRWKLRRNDWDACSFSIDSTNSEFIVPGAAMPGYPNMKAVDVNPTQQGDEWLFDVEYKGFKDPTETWRQFSRVDSSPSEGFDNVALVIGTKIPNDPFFARGSTLPDDDEFPNMYIVDRSREVSDVAGFSVLNLQLRGLLGEKPYTRRVTCNGRTVNTPGNWEMFDSTNNLSEDIDGWPGYSMLTEFTLANIVVVDSFITTTLPPWAGIPGNVTPDDPPDVTVFSFTTSEPVRWHWPYGWRRVNVQSEQIPGKDLWFVSVTYDNQQLSLPDAA